MKGENGPAFPMGPLVSPPRRIQNQTPIGPVLVPNSPIKLISWGKIEIVQDSEPLSISERTILLLFHAKPLHASLLGHLPRLVLLLSTSAGETISAARPMYKPAELAVPPLRGRYLARGGEGLHSPPAGPPAAAWMLRHPTSADASATI